MGAIKAKCPDVLDAIERAQKNGDIRSWDDGKYLNFLGQKAPAIYNFFKVGGYINWEIVREYVLADGLPLEKTFDNSSSNIPSVKAELFVLRYFPNYITQNKNTPWLNTNSN